MGKMCQISQVGTLLETIGSVNCGQQMAEWLATSVKMLSGHYQRDTQPRKQTTEGDQGWDSDRCVD